MKLGKIIGKVWTTRKDVQLTGIPLLVMQPVDDKQKPKGKPIIVADSLGVGQDELVFWVSSTEASVVFPDKKIPSDASIVGIVDSTYLEKPAKLQERIEILKNK